MWVMYLTESKEKTGIVTNYLKKLLKYLLRGGDVKISMAGIMLNCDNLKTTAISLPLSDLITYEIRVPVAMYQPLAIQVINCPVMETALLFCRFLSAAWLNKFSTVLLFAICFLNKKM